MPHEVQVPVKVVKYVLDTLNKMGMEEATFGFGENTLVITGLDPSKTTAFQYTMPIENEEQATYVVPIDRFLKWVRKLRANHTLLLRFEDNKMYANVAEVPRKFRISLLDVGGIEDIVVKQLVETVNGAKASLFGTAFKPVIDMASLYEHVGFILRNDLKGIMYGEEQSGGVREEYEFELTEYNFDGEEFEVLVAGDKLELAKNVAQIVVGVEMRFAKDMPLVVGGAAVTGGEAWYVVAPVVG